MYLKKFDLSGNNVFIKMIIEIKNDEIKMILKNLASLIKIK